MRREMAKVNITQVRSRIGATKTQCKNLDALGLRKMGRTVQHEDSATIMGMIERVKHLVKLDMNAAPKAEAKAPVKKVAEVKKAVAPKAESDCEVAETVKKAAPKAAKPAAAKKPAAPKATAEKKASAAPKAAKPAAAKKPAAPKAAKKTEE